MFVKHLAIALLVSAGVPVYAQPTTLTPKHDTSELRRAEVLADLDIWSTAGMRDVTALAEIGEDITQTQQYRHYLELRNGPQFQATVKRRLECAGMVADARSCKPAQ